MDKKIEEADWVGLRLLYLTMALDGSSVTIPEVANIADYYTRKFGYDEIRKAFDDLRHDPYITRCFDNNPASKAVREYQKTLNIKGFPIYSSRWRRNDE